MCVCVCMYEDNCWFLASVGALTSQKRIMKQVINDEQNFSVDYAGIFHFKVNIQTEIILNGMI